VSSVKLISLGLRSDLRLLVTDVSLLLVVEQDVTVYPLYVCNLENLANKLLGPICPVKVTAHHC
jgi:hypothetical protein